MKQKLHISSFILLLVFTWNIAFAAIPHHHHKHEVAESSAFGELHKHDHDHDKETSDLHYVWELIHQIHEVHSHSKDQHQHDQQESQRVKVPVQLQHFLHLALYLIQTLEEDDTLLPQYAVADAPMLYSGVDLPSHSLRGPPSLV